ncbi:M48 family metallopeptidase [Anaerophilus nitritogenes]|uniref:M48 family metallopeptidase n=1 Tax=Anaerophilus nitritogenes TaxID=2498136 RepID=UPI00101D368A|nr:SprT family zinc-dependent metalloprotease [Anaerophilus nitritogenes]
MDITYKDQTIIFAIEYKKRKTIQIEIDPACRVKVLAPKGTKEERIVELIKEKAPDILEKINQIRTKDEIIKEQKHKNEGSLLYLGNNYSMQVIIDENVEKERVILEEDTFIIIVKSNEKLIIDIVLEKYYKRKCKEIIGKRVGYYQKYFKTKVKDVKIVVSQSKWGSCDSDRNLEFNWRLIRAPLEVIDYIVVHELCHLEHMNHDRSFWRLVGKIIPDYKERSEWLKYNGMRI